MERQVWNPVTGWWENVPTPRSVSVLATAAHFVTALAGLVVILQPPLFLAAGLGDGLLTYYWGGLLLAGGLVSGFAVLPGAYWAERIGLAAMGLALVLYVVAMVDLQLLQGAATNVTYQALLNLVLGLHIVIRWERVRYGMREASDPENLNTGPIGHTTGRRRR